MWKKNLLFAGLLIVGISWLGTSLLRRERITPPKDFRPAAFFPREESDNPLAAATQALNADFRNDWKQHRLDPTTPADEMTVIRRLSLALTGTVPSLEEIRAVEKVQESDRVDWWISYLLENRRTYDYFAERLARPMIGTEDGPFIVFRRSRFTNWLADQLQKNVPYDQSVREIIASEGIWTNNPAVNYMSVSFDAGGTEKLQPIKLAARTARTFLATRIDCLQCHDDNLGSMNFGVEQLPGKQTHFHEFAAYFGESKISLRGVSDTQEQEYKTTYLGETDEVVVAPAIPFAKESLDGHGRPREQLAKWITDPKNKAFSRATVNRVWAILFGRPLVEPIDDIPHKGPYPAGLELLADDFAAHGFDMKRLVRVIAASEAYRLDSAADFEITEEHEKHWAVFPLTRLRPEQMAGAVVQAGQVSTIDNDAHVIWKVIKVAQTNEFVTRYGDTGSDEFSVRAGTIPQRLLMMNGDFVKERTQFNPAMGAPARIAAMCTNEEAAIEAVYLSVLTRRPSPAELAHFVAQFADQSNDRSRANQVEDLYWTLVNSSEFSWNH